MANKIVYIIAAIAGCLAFVIGIIIGHFAISKNQTPQTWTYDRLTRQANQQNYRTYIDSVQARSIEADLKDLTSRPHLAGLPEDRESAEVIEQRWKQDGLFVTKPKYNVLLSYPDENKTNLVTLYDSNGAILFQTNGTEAVYDPTQPKIVNPFLAYTPNGNVSSTKFYYANYGREEDFKILVDRVGSGNLTGSIIIMRYGRIFRGDKVMQAQHYGAVGAILYNDPADYAPFGTTPDQVYDKKWYMPPSGAQRGSAYTANGDPLTPVYPATDYMFRVDEDSVEFLPRIPAQPISYSEAEELLKHLDENSGLVPDGWSGNINVTYRLGGILSNAASIEVTSYNRRERKDTYNVVGIMKGEIEPDRYVVIGNHRDAWSLGVMDPTSGTATLLEITRVLGEMYKNGFRPRRSLMFCSWGAEEYGLIGSVEYAQQYVKVLGARIVSYLNMDIAVEGNFTVDIQTSPLLFDVIVEAAKMVPSAYDPDGMTVYDKWMKVKVNNETNEPLLSYGLGSGSDYYGFDQLAGSSNMDTNYMFDRIEHRNIASYPLYHTSYEVFSMMKTFVDPEFTAHRTMAQFVGVLALLISEPPVLKFNVTRYTIALTQIVKSLPGISNSTIAPLQQAIDIFDSTSKDFVARSQSLDTNNPYEIRFYNDQLLQLERAFLNPLGQGGDNTDLKHIVFAPAKNNQYAASGFPAITDAIATGNQTEIEKQIAIAAFFVHSATSVLKDFTNFFA